MSEPSELGSAVGRLVGQLARWAKASETGTAEGSRARAALAHLRHGLGKSRGEAIDAWRHVVPLVRDEAREWEQEVFFLVATLFAKHPVNRERAADEAHGTNFGEVFRAMEDRQTSSEPVEASERRFVALLNASPERLPTHLRHAVGIAAGKGTPVDWKQLTWDLLSWADPERRNRVKLNWSRAYWGYRRPEETPAESQT